MNNIDTLIFDFGGVIINLDYRKPVDEFKKLGIFDSKKLYSKKEQTKLFDSLECGQISDENFLNEIRKKSNTNNLELIKKAWNSILLNIPKERVHLLKKLSSKYKIFLISNTNSIHLKEIISSYGEKKWKNFISIFNDVYFSNQIGMRKPNENIFFYVINKNKLDVSKTLFIDDSLQHIKTAKKIGFKTYHLSDKEDIINLFLEKAQ
ncbi:HAD family phosphatase [Bacteroidota bacterium]|nr:HAD family phosphatase [Bacteroidota bacterium]MDC3115050.1 HAD family phosphatase [Bacteroidota bacterium]MDC3130428.1 HAD family phosphatase [Bacteroidota bacterium]MDC3230456.1 HAD family phosphatase [Bacteroidota bacterium]